MVAKLQHARTLFLIIGQVVGCADAMWLWGVTFVSRYFTLLTVNILTWPN